jgi:DNA-binding MarR family transcriptional regulator
MDAVFFASKRAHYAGVAMMRPLLRDVGLTPARFDLLSALEGLPLKTQKALREVLGVARATLSEMIVPLERAGLVKRWPCWWDMRTRILGLTALGRAVLQRVRAKWTDSGEVTLAVDSCFASKRSFMGGGELRRWYLDLTQGLREWFGRGVVPRAYELAPHELAAAFASFEDEPDVPWVE